MTAIRNLNFVHRSALYRGDGGGVAVILRDRPFPGSCWARVESAGAGITAEFLRLDSGSGGPTDGHIVVEDQLWAVSGDADDGAPSPHDPDPRLTALGSAFETDDVPYAREADAATGVRQAEANERIAANSFNVRGTMDGRSWRVRVGPTRMDGTSLECQADDGEVRVVDTTATRAALERARMEPITVTATFIERRRRLLGGFDSRTRTLEVTLLPDDRK